MRHMAPTMSRQDSRARAQEADRLRNLGRTWSEVAEAVGFKSHGAAQLAVARLHKRNPCQSADQVRRSATEGLRIVRAVLFEQFAEAKQRGDNDDLVMLARELRSNISENTKLNGAYAPQRTEFDVTVRQSATAIINEARERLLSVVDAEVIEPFSQKGIER
jgi:hypothetical protein